MKSYICAILVLVLYVPASAQILEKIGKKIEKSVERRVEKRIDKAVEKGLDKAEYGTEDAVEGALTGKDKTGAAYPDIKLTGSGPDLFLEYRMHVESKAAETGQMQISMKMYVSTNSGKGRAETIMELPVVGTMRMTALTDMHHPERVTLLNDRRKEYTSFDLSEVEETTPQETFTVKRLGVVNFRGMQCIHSEAVDARGERFEIWTTRDIPGYQDMVALYRKSQRMGSDGLWKALEEAGCAGFMVKFRMDVEDAASVMELMNIEKTSLEDSIFQIPSGYQQKSGGWAKQYLKGTQ